MLKVICQNIEAAIYRNRYKDCLVKSKNNIELYKRQIDRFTTEYRSFKNKKPIRKIVEQVSPDSTLNRGWVYPFNWAHVIEKNVFDYRTQKGWQTSNITKFTGDTPVTFHPAEKAPYYTIPAKSFLKTIIGRGNTIYRARTATGNIVAINESAKCKDNVYREISTVFANGEKKVYYPEYYK